MDLQVLVATMHQIDYSILKKMNINSDAIVINQSDKHEYDEFIYRGNAIRFFSFAERGVGLSRNTALMRATADICIFADEDMTYVDDYKEIIINAFNENPDADMILFNVPSTNLDRPTNNITSKNRVRWYNCLRYGAVNFAVRTEKIRRKNIHFSLLFGGGAKYNAGEDSMFIADCIKKGFKIYTEPKIIGYVSQEDSSWFKGYTDNYFINKGAFYGILSRKFSKLLCLQFAIRHRKMFRKEKTWIEAYNLMKKGIQDIK